ncbi:hypothetical protein PJI16_03040 [Nitrospira sp. MA-1]|nr:hypothetical protein [Nitrospira sp. MA-1]
MSKTLLEPIKVEVSTLEQVRSKCTERLQTLESANGDKFDFSKVIPGIDQSIGDIDARVLGLIGLATGLNGDVELDLVPNKFATEFHSNLSQVTQQYQALNNSFDELKKQGGVGTLDPIGFTVQNENAQINIPIHKIFKQIQNTVENALVFYYPLANIINGPQFSDFSYAFSEFSKQLANIQRMQANLSQVVIDGEKAKKHIESLQKQADVLKEELDRLKIEGEKDRKTIAEYTEESTQKVTAIRTTNEQAEILKTGVLAYQANFESFKKELLERETTFKTGKEQQENLIKELGNIKDDIKTLTEQAEGMLTGATVAGLAGSFGDIRDKLEKELKGARWIFYFAVFLLFLSVLPLLAYVLPGISWVSGKEPDVSTTEFFGQIIVRALLLLPAGWFAKFAAVRHAALFRLKENYAYKYSVASSVDGFKKQAEPFKDAIAAATFFELTFNPADRMEGKGNEERHPNPAMEWVMKKLGATYDGK